MNWESRYLPPDPSQWQGRTDVPQDSCFYQHIRLFNLLTDKPPQATSLTFAILGFKCDEGTRRASGRIGASEGPAIIRQRLAKLPIQKPYIQIFDAGDIVCADHDLEASQKALANAVSLLLEQNIRPIVLGGGHEVAWGHYQGIVKVYPSIKRLGIINFDAHFDLHPLHSDTNGNAATTFYQIANAKQNGRRHLDYNCIGIQHAGNIRQSFDIAKKLGVKIILADELHQGLQEKCFDFIDRVADENDIIYLSLSLDVFSPAFAPGVSATQPLGLHPWHLIPLIRQAASSGKVISYDIAELVPRYDIDQCTSKLAAALIYEIIHHHQEHSKIALKS